MSNTVAKPTDIYLDAEQKRALPRTLMGGTDAMRKAGKTYLPQEAAESEVAYNDRVNRTFLFNGYRKTAKDMSGKVFTKPVQMGEDVPAKLKTYAENIDLTGQGLNNFAYSVFEAGMNDGISYILVEMPPAQEGATRKDDIDSGRRPYLVLIEACSLIGFKSKVIAGHHVLTQVRILETAVEDDPDDEFGQIEVQQVRVFDRDELGVQYRVYRQQKVDGKEEWILTASGMTSLKDITLVPFYANRTGFMMGEPPLSDLAYLNLAHWQSSSDQRNILHVARVPMLFAKGFGEEDRLVVGANSFTRTTSENADMKYVEHSGKAIEAGSNDLDDLEFQMQTQGLELLTPKPGSQTATGEAIDQAKMNSPLAMMADNLKDALEQAFGFMGEYEGLGKDTGGSITVNTDFGITLRDATDLTTLLAAVNAGQISRETFIKELIRRGVLMGDIDPEEEAERIEGDAESLGLIKPPAEDDNADGE
ncbi:DUF4055 domain-containing protein [Rhizobium phaseoli]|uniref:DUF4055 domain-containing protein n=1 Tax=Rhizobium phaseoli TaxID=396 RepID=A0ABM6C8X2_9HYPH|nr:DUF4055 domain-containing protein [Rhizobium phaseoli]ANL84662.1 hypothetical protein AMC81_CH01881 [Rhizobium phaseoli]ANL91169.1 hypothetical protein AMC80_CH01881 [Rhizobium phaseoli]